MKNSILLGSTVTILLNLHDDFEIDRDVKFKMITSYNNIFIGTVTIG